MPARALLGLALVLTLASPLRAGEKHPFHSSVCEWYFQSKEGLWEISLRLFQDDFEQVLSAHAGKTIKIQANAPGLEELMESYLRKHLGFEYKQQLQSPYRFLGWEIQQDVVWVYMEMPSRQDLNGTFLHNSLFTEVFADQTNLTHLVYQDRKKSLLFQKNKTVQGIQW